MRISDWSSDVCSSDLHALGIEAVQDDLEALAFLADAVCVGNEQVFDEKHVRIDRVTTHLVNQPHFDLAAVEVGVEQGQTVGLALDLIRSEEHTSELQSIMRIQYDVICMKKTTKQR